ncbi:MAG TPA: hypothetical protein VGW11_13200 [Solirubrobacteraceae bacterium]|nr:hypothetical protein [Solirubrobacteraceae bacterium]
MRRALCAIVLALAGTLSVNVAPAAAAGGCPNDAQAFAIASDGSLPSLAQRDNVIGWQPYAELGEQSINRRTCRDLDGDGDVDFAIEVACCTVSRPSLVVIYERFGHGGFGIAYRRFTPVRGFERQGRALIITEPRYAGSDANCCPSRIAVRKIFHRPGRFTSTTRITRP